MIWWLHWQTDISEEHCPAAANEQSCSEKVHPLQRFCSAATVELPAARTLALRRLWGPTSPKTLWPSWDPSHGMSSTVPVATHEFQFLGSDSQTLPIHIILMGYCKPPKPLIRPPSPNNKTKPKTALKSSASPSQGCLYQIPLGDREEGVRTELREAEPRERHGDQGFRCMYKNKTKLP